MIDDVPVAAEVRFGRESGLAFLADAQWPLLKAAHWEEVAHYPDIAIEPDYDRYLEFERNGILRIYTVRTDGRLDGYAIFLLSTAMNYRQTITAQEATVFVHRRARHGQKGREFIRWTEAQMRTEGVSILTRHVKYLHDAAHGGAFVRMLERQGYEIQDYILTKRLDL